MDNDIDATEAITNRVGHDRAAFGGRKIRRDEQIGVSKFRGCFSSGGKHLHTSLPQPRDDRFANPLRATRDKRPAVIQFEIVAHEQISTDAITPAEALN
jgi:hypothetical protein